jgi:hypothetical protein
VTRRRAAALCPITASSMRHICASAGVRTRVSATPIRTTTRSSGAKSVSCAAQTKWRSRTPGTTRTVPTAGAAPAPRATSTSTASSPTKKPPCLGNRTRCSWPSEPDSRNANG